MPNWRRAALVSLVLCLAAAPARAQYRFDSYTTSNGLPQNTVAALAQTRDGFLWIGTYDGLVRYDGVRFTTFDKGNTPAIRSTQFLNVFEDSHGTLWAGSGEGGVVRYRDGVFSSLTAKDGLAEEFVSVVQESPRGVLLFYANEHLAGLLGADGKVHPADAAARREYVGPSGARWTHAADRITVARGTHTESYLAAVPLEDFERFRFEARDGSLWIGSRRSGVYHLADGTAQRYGPEQGVPVSEVVRIGGEDLGGRVWVHSSTGLLYFDGMRLVPFDIGRANIRAVLCDREGTVWVGTNDRGLIHFAPDVLHSYAEAEGLPARVVYPLAEDRDGTILTGSAANVARLANGRFTSIALPRVARSLFVDPADGAVWIGLAPGLATLADGKVTDRSALVKGNGVDAMLRDRHGVLWAGGSNGLFRIDPSGTRAFGVADGLPANTVSVLLEDRVGRLWVGTPKGLARRDGERFDPDPALQGERVRSLYEDSSGALWIGTFDDGLRRVKDGAVTSYTTQTGLFSNGVFAILEDAHGWFWMSSNRGIFRVPRRQLEEVAQGTRALVTSIAYGTADGMRSVECNGGRQSAALKGRDGRLWFPTSDGIVVIDPERAHQQGPPPQVTVEAALIDGIALPPHSGLRVEPGPHDVEFSYTAPSFAKAEHIQFRYMLAGLNTGWIDAGTRRTVHYSGLPPGNYTFRVAAAGADGEWNGKDAAIALRVLPYFYQTSWFRAAVLVGMVLLGLAISTLRVRRLKDAERRLQARVDEATAELATANWQLALMATTDALTQLANRRQFSEFLDHEWQRAMREGTAIALLMMDVDFFKKFNDTHGHQGGDACLQRVAAAIASCVKRTTDLAARYGGEEFAVVLPGADEAGARLLGEQIRAEVERQAMPHGASAASACVTVSVGAAVVVPVAGLAAESLVAAADAALYRAKESGRNTVVAGMIDLSPDAPTVAPGLPRVRIHHPGS